MSRLLKTGNSGILTQRGSVMVDFRTNALIIKELPGNMDAVLSLIDLLDAPEPQVMIEARIVETTKRFSRELGVKWSVNAIADAAHGNTTGLVFPSTGIGHRRRQPASATPPTAPSTSSWATCSTPSTSTSPWRRRRARG